MRCHVLVPAPVTLAAAHGFTACPLVGNFPNRVGGQPCGFLIGQCSGPIVALVWDTENGTVRGYGDLLGRSK